MLRKRSIPYLLSALLMFVSLVTSLAFPAQDAQASSGFMAGRIIDDSVFTDYGTMSVSNIQFFLNSKGVNCVNGQAPCLKNFSENGHSAAQIIYDTAQEFRINPQVLIVVLQKEVGLVTISQPASWRYRTAMGYGCPDTAPCDAEYYGFTNQMRWAARMYRAIMNASPTWYTPYVVGNNFIQWNPNGACGGTNVYIENRATQALYNYTPYQPNTAALNAGYGMGDGCSSYGNRNFYLYFKDWFGESRQSPIVRSPSSPTYYLLTNNKKYAIPSGDLLYAYGLEAAPLSIVSDAYLSTISDGGMLDTIFTVPGDNTVFLADSGKKHGIASGEYCTRWGLACGNAAIQKVVGPEIVNLMGNGGVLQPVMKFAGQYYLMENGKKKQFLSAKAMTDRGYSTAGSTPITSWTNATRPFDVSLPEDKTFVKFGSGPGIYLYSDNQFFAIPDYDTFVAWQGAGIPSYLDATSSYNSAAPAPAGLLSTLITDGSSVSLLRSNQKLNLTGAQPTITPFSTVGYPQLQSIVATRPAVAVTEAQALALPNGSINALRNGELRPIPSMTDLQLSYKDSDVISVPNTATGAYPIGKLNIVAGRVFKPNDSGAMYVYGADGKLWALGSLGELQSVLKWRNSVVESTFTNVSYSDINVYNSLANVSGTPYAVLSDGSLRRLPYGVLSAGTMPLSGDMLKVLTFNTNLAGFIRFDNGTIFRVDSTELRPIGSLATYRSLGGNADNTISLPLKSLSEFQVGSSL
jgi:hypothetical protein